MKQIKIDDLRKTGFSKEGKHRNPQIILGLLVSIEGYPLAYCIHEGNKYEGHTMLSMIEKFVKEHQLQDFVVVADSKLMTESNLSELERLKCKYIIGVRLKNESKKITDWVLQQPKINQQMVESEKENGRKLLVGYTDDRAKKDAYNRQKELHRLEKLYVKGRITKDQINKKGYNKF
ncbi:MAG: transposase, partial [Bacteroidales bacterium]